MAQPLRTHTTLKEGWRFMKEGQSEWQSVTVPHDWAIYGPFDRENDIQRVAVVQNGERDPSDKTGRTGGLPRHAGDSPRPARSCPAQRAQAYASAS